MFLPGLIYEKIALSEKDGVFDAATMFLDITGFTRITEELSRYGEEGAEIVSSLLNQVFFPIVRIIHASGGFIATFAGDAITVVFPNDATQALLGASQIQELFHVFEDYETRFGHFSITSSTGLSFGPVEWGILGEHDLLQYYFRGDGISGAIQAASSSGMNTVIFDEHLEKRLERGVIEYSQYGECSYKLGSVQKEFFSTASMRQHQGQRERDIDACFYPIDDFPETQTGEFRDVISIFISFAGDLLRAELKTFITELRSQCTTYGGYFNLLDFGDKGGLILIVFGAPLTYENAIERALNFILAIKTKGLLVDKKTGLDLGRVYSGILGSSQRCIYTVIGDSVNTSARIMQHTPKSSIYTGKNISSKAAGFTFAAKDKIKVKGKQVPVVLYELLSKSKPEAIRKRYSGELIGRTKELEKLSKLIKPLSSGKNGNVVTIYGQPGIGKSRFVHEFLYRNRFTIHYMYLKADSILIKSFHPFASFFRDFFSYPGTRQDFDRAWTTFLDRTATISKPKINEVIQELKRTRSYIAALVGILWTGSRYDTSDAQMKYENTLSAIKAFIKTMSLIKPLIITLDDFQWFDDESKKSVKNMLINVKNFPFITLILSRYDDKGEKHGFELDDVRTTEIDLKRFNKTDQKTMMASKLGCTPSQNLSQYIHSKTSGNPFYIEQYCLYFQERRLLVKTNKQCDLKKEIEVEIPQGIRNVIVARIDRLSQKLKKMVQQASVLGEEVDVKVLSLMLKGAPITQLFNKGEELEIWHCINELLYLFKHVMMREAAYSMLLKSRLRELHGLAAQGLEQLYRDMGHKWADIAYHYELADNIQKARDYTGKAAVWAKENYRNQEAVELFSKLLTYESVQDDYDIIVHLSELYELTGEWDKAQQILEEHSAKAKVSGPESTFANLSLHLGVIYNNKGDYNKAMDCFASANLLFQKLKKWSQLANGISNIGAVYDNTAQYDKAIDTYQDALIKARQSRDERIESTILNNIGAAYYKIGEFDKALYYQHNALNLKQKVSNKKSVSDTLHNIGNIHNRTGNIKKALDYYHQALEISLEIGDKAGTAITFNNIGTLFLERGDYKQALKFLKKSIGTVRELGDKLSESTIICNIGLIYNRTGEPKKALENFKKAQSISLKINDSVGAAAALGGMGLVYLDLEDYDTALKKFEAALTIRQEMGDKRGIGLTLKNIGVTNLKLKQYDEALATFEQALDVFTKIKFKLGIGAVLDWMGDLFIQLDKREKALELFKQAIEIFQELQMTKNKQLVLKKIEELSNHDNC